MSVFCIRFQQKNIGLHQKKICLHQAIILRHEKKVCFLKVNISIQQANIE